VIGRLALAGGMLGIVMAVGSASAASSSIASPVSDAGAAASPAAAAATAARCAPVWFIGARGSGESATGFAGMGAAVGYMESVVASDLRGKGLAISTKAIDYPADSVDVLIPNKAVLALLALGQVDKAAALYAATSVDPYEASMDKGIKEAEAAVASVLASCPDAKIIMAGYSQGAVVVHDAENWLAKNKRAEFGHVAGTLLLGDPDRVQYTKARTFGTAPKDAEGLRVRLHLVTPHEVPEPADTAEIANADDVVGDFAFSHIDTRARAEHSASVHTSYAHADPKDKKKMIYEPVLKQAADWIASKVPGLGPADPSIRIGGTAYGPIPAGQVTAGQLTAAGGTAPYAYRILSLDYGRAPSWVLLTTSGKLTISPPAGLHGESFAFHVYATDHTGRHSPLTGGLVTFTLTAGWGNTAVPLPRSAAGQPNVTLMGASCPSAAFCMAVGDYSDGSGDNYQDGLLLTERAGKWAAQQAPLPPDAVPYFQYELDSVSCPTSAFCVATGTYEEPGDIEGIILTWSGGTWSAIQAPLPVTATAGQQDAAVTAVSCPTSSSCTAVGVYETGAGDVAAMILTRSGGSWAVGAGQLPANATAVSSDLSAVSCPSVSRCTAVGGYTDASGDQDGMLLISSGGSWAASEAPAPGNAASNPFESLQRVSCPSASFCMATGYYNEPSTSAGVILEWSAGKWTAEQATFPGQPGTLVGVTGVSCPSVSWCSVTGSSTDDAVILTWSGSAWAAVHPKDPANADDGIHLSGVSCAAPSSCISVGDYWDTDGDLVGVLADQPG
jgi:hypothetical protein